MAVAQSPVVLLEDEGASMGQAVEQVLRAASAVVEDRLELGRLELTERTTRIGTGLACFGVSVFFAICAWIALLAAASFGLARMLPEDASLAIVGGANLLLAGVLAWLGRRRVTRSPEQA